MDFKDQIKQLAEKISKIKDQLQTEEATKNALIMPFIQCLGYDVFNPLEVIPEFIADMGIKKGEKVDYAIMKNNQPIILIECKSINEKLDPHSTQLFRYFTTTKSKFGLLTNGVVYRFYTDLVELNKMDEKPFLEFDITNIKDNLIEELKKFHKSYFDMEQILSAASELKYVNEIKIILANELKSPSEKFTKFFINEVYQGRATEKIIDFFEEIVKKSFNQFINDIVNDRFQSAIDNEEKKQKIEEKPVELETKENEKETTAIELEGFFTVKSILRTKIDASRITYKDTLNYFNIILDGSVRKIICRLYLDGKKKYISLIDENKEEKKQEIASIDDIYKYSDNLIKTALSYDVIK